METEKTNFVAQLTSLWSRMNSNERMVLVISALVLIIALVVWLTVGRSQGYALLYGGLEPSDAANIVDELQSLEVDYKITDGGKGITVPADEVDELRLALASDGFTPSGTTGYELFDKSALGMSDFLQRQNRNRAIEGELSRTLMSLDEVSAARVHLTLPEPTPFISDQIDPMASVVLQLHPPGTALSNDRIAAVRTFVAGAIGSLDPGNVTIIDQNMNLLTGPTPSHPGMLLPTQVEARTAYEQQRAAAIRSLLERTYGVGKVAVSFACEMDFDQVESESLTVEPLEGTDHGVLISQERSETSEAGEGLTGAAGIPGTESNIPSYPSAAGQPYESDTSTETKNYEASTTHEIRVEAPGQVQHSSVGVLIDYEDENGPLASEITNVENLIKAAAGISTDTGDILTVAFMPFDTTLEEQLAASRAEFDRSQMWSNISRIVIVLVVLGIFWMVLKNFLKPMELAYAGPTYAADEIDESIELPSADPETLEKLRIREEIEKLIKEDPSSAAKVIKTWLRE